MAVVVHRSSRVAAWASRSSRSRRAASWASAASGSMTSRIRRPRMLQVLGVVLAGERRSGAARPGRPVGVEVGGELGQGAEDGLGLLDVDPALGERGTGQVVGLEPVGEPDGPVCLDAGGAGGDRVPVRGRGTRRCRRRCRSVWRGTAVGPSARPAGPRRPGPRRSQRWSRWRPWTTPACPAISAELIADTGERPGDRVRLVRDRCHGIHSSTDHRHPWPPGIPLWTTDSGSSGCGRKVDVPGSVPGPG